MAARRSSRSRSGGGSRRAASSSSNPLPIVIGGAAVVVILIAFATMSSDDKNPKPSVDAATKEPDTAKEEPKVGRQASSARKKNLKDPDTPAPAISESILTEANELYKKAKQQHDDARRAQSAGENAKFNALINDSWDTLERLDSKLEVQLIWLEEADMEDWKIPTRYIGLQRLIEKYSRLKGQVKRIKPNRR